MRFISIFFLFQISCLVSISENVPKLADSLYLEKKYYDAITEYKRFSFFNKDSKILDSVYFQIALAYRYINELQKSNEFFYQALSINDTPGFRGRTDLELGINHLCSGSYDVATNYFDKIINASDDTNTIRQAYFYNFIADILEFNFVTAKTHFTSYCNLTPFEETLYDNGRILHLLDSINAHTNKDVHRAMWFSTLIPGLGQVYCNDYKNGVNAFLINMSLLGSLTISVINANYLNAIVTALIFQNFYRGNRIRTGEICNLFNNKNNIRFRNIIFHELLTNSLVISTLNFNY